MCGPPVVFSGGRGFTWLGADHVLQGARVAWRCLTGLSVAPDDQRGGEADDVGGQREKRADYGDEVEPLLHRILPGWPWGRWRFLAGGSSASPDRSLRPCRRKNPEVRCFGILGDL